MDLKQNITNGEILMSPIITVMGFTFNVYGVVLLAIALFFISILYFSHKESKVNWIDLISRDGKTLSTSKLLQLITGIVATWIMIQVTMGGSLTWDLFVIYLAYGASVDGFSKLLLAKYGIGTPTEKYEVRTETTKTETLQVAKKDE